LLAVKLLQKPKMSSVIGSSVSPGQVR